MKIGHLLIGTLPLFGLAQTTLAQDSARPTAVIDTASPIPLRGDLVLRADRSTDSGGQIVQYEWTRLSGSGGAIPLNEPFIFHQPLFTVPQSTTNPLAIGQHRFQLRVLDDSGNISNPAISNVTVIDVLRPTAVLDCPSPVAVGAAIVLHGQRSSDPDGAIVQYEWARQGQPVIRTSDSRLTIAEGLPPGVHHFQLEVMDNSGNRSLAVQCRIHAGDFTPPIAVARAPSAVSYGDSFVLSARGSKDAGGQIVRYRWTRISGAGGSPAINVPVDLSSTDLKVVQPQQNPMQPGAHRYRLVVTDNSGNQSAPVDVEVFVNKSQRR